MCVKENFSLWFRKFLAKGFDSKILLLAVGLDTFVHVYVGGDPKSVVILIESYTTECADNNNNNNTRF